MTAFGHFLRGIHRIRRPGGGTSPGCWSRCRVLIAILGGLSITLGYKAKIGGWLIVLFLVPVTLALHNFWAVTDPMMRGMQIAMFMKNVSMLGARAADYALWRGPSEPRRAAASDVLGLSAAAGGAPMCRAMIRISSALVHGCQAVRLHGTPVGRTRRRPLAARRVRNCSSRYTARFR